MTNKIDYNALLLRILAHDILSPLTAVKWQVELLEKNFKKRDKRERYLTGINESTKLGITIVRHSHIAANVLSGSYEGSFEKANLPLIVKQAVSDLHLQYERHGISLNVDINSENKLESNVDVALVQLFVWSIAKFFMTCVSPNSTVLSEGKKGLNENEFVFEVSVLNMNNAKDCAEIFTSENAGDAYDQKYVFAKLINEIAPMLGVEMDASGDLNTLKLKTLFKL